MDLNDFLDVFSNEVRSIRQQKGGSAEITKAVHRLVQKSKGLVLRSMLNSRDSAGYAKMYRSISLLRGLSLIAALGSFVWAFVSLFIASAPPSLWIAASSLLLLSEAAAFFKRYLVGKYLLHTIRDNYDENSGRPKRFDGLFDYGDKIQLLLFSTDDDERAFVIKSNDELSLIYESWREGGKRGGKWIKTAEQPGRVSSMEEAINLIKEKQEFRNNTFIYNPLDLTA